MTDLGPLAGIRVVDLSRALSGPYASLMLADAGAEVIKVERPGAGDDSRGWGPPFVGGEGHDDPESAYFLSINRSKRSVVLDLKDAGDVDRLRDLLTVADVLVENFRPGVMERLGLGPGALEALNRRLVVLSITGFGEGGPDGDRSGFDQIIQGEAGLMGITGPVGGPPTKFGVPITDILSGMFGAYGVIAALHERERSGQGQRVTTSLLAAAVGVHAFQGTRWTLGGEVPEPGGNHHPSIAPYGAYACADGHVNVAVGSEGLWRRFAPAVGLDVDDPRYATNADRVAHRDALTAEIDAALQDETVEAWMVRFDAAGVPAGRIRTMDEVYGWAQLAHLDLVDHVVHPTAGNLDLPGSPVRWSRSGRRPPEPPPTLGQHDAGLNSHRHLGVEVPAIVKMPTDPAELTAALAEHAYLADRGLATALHLALSLGRPLLLEGDAGVGKTEAAKALAAVLDAELVRLQCHEGIDRSQALYAWDHPRQLLHLRAMEASGQLPAEREAELYDRRFLLARPLLRSLQLGHRGVLLVDEIDRADDEFEAFLLELLSDAQVSIPELGTIRAATPPIVVLTSNRTRELSDALKRRCLYHWIDHPDRARESAIVRLRAPEVPDALAHRVCDVVARLRDLDLHKPPGVAETVDWARVFVPTGARREEVASGAGRGEADGPWSELDRQRAVDTLGVVIKDRDDLDVVRAAIDDVLDA